MLNSSLAHLYCMTYTVIRLGILLSDEIFIWVDAVEIERLKSSPIHVNTKGSHQIHTLTTTTDNVFIYLKLRLN